MIVGVTGSTGAGKDIVADYLATKGFAHFSLSEVLRKELKKQNKEITRENLINMGNELRETYGAGALGFIALESIEPYKKYVVTSIRHPSEAAALRRKEGFVLIHIDASPEIRFKRTQLRQKAGEDFTKFEDFIAAEQKEQSSSNTGQQLHKMKGVSNIVINNEGTLEELHQKMDDVLKEFLSKVNLRPNWDEYFSGLARYVGTRGTCDRGKTGTVIVKNKRVLSMGYVGAPTGLPHCDEAGHELQIVENADNTKSFHCIRTTHAEQNAINNAACHGISIEGSSIYCKLEPCYTCAKLIVNAGIKRVVCEQRYHRAQRSREVFKQAQVELVVLNDELSKYHGQTAGK